MTSRYQKQNKAAVGEWSGQRRRT